MTQVTFFMEQHVGHKTYYQNLRKYIETDSRISATWIPVTYDLAPKSFMRRIPYLSSHFQGTLAGWRQTREGLRNHKSDVSFFFTQVPAMFGGRLLQRVPYVLCTDLTPIQFDQMGEHYGHTPDKIGLVRNYKQQVNARVFKKAAQILPWTRWAEQSFISDYGVSPGKLTILPIGLDINKWCPSDNSSRGVVKILFVGADFFRKGGDLLLDAFHDLPSGHAELVIVTRTTLPEQEGIKIYNDLQPNTPELVALFQSCDIFVLPTKADAFGIVAAEASATGLPVLMTDVGGASDIVVDGETGFLLPLEDVLVLTERLKFLIMHENIRRRMGAAARARAEQCFDARKNGKKVADILLEVAEVDEKKLD